MKKYTTKGGEMIDEICAAHYGSDKKLLDVMRVNPGIETMPFLLPAGVEINLPALSNEKVKGVSLW